MEVYGFVKGKWEKFTKNVNYEAFLVIRKSLNLHFNKEVTMITESKKTAQRKSKAKVSNKVKNYGNDPFFVKKAKESKEFLEKHGFQKELLLRNKLSYK